MCFLEMETVIKHNNVIDLMLINSLLLFLSICYMNNLFTSKIIPNIDNFTVSSTFLTREDYSKYLIYEETHKVINPESFTFLKYKIKFIAFKIDAQSNITSIIIYIHHSDDLIETLKQEFGDYYSSFSLSGEMSGLSNQQISYETLAWKNDNNVMLVAPPQISQESLSDEVILTRVWFKTLE